MLRAVYVSVVTGDLAGVIDPGEPGTAAQSVIDRRVDASVIEEAVHRAAAVHVVPDDLARVVDAASKGLSAGGRWIVERGVVAAANAIEEAVLPPAAVNVVANNLARVVDA